MNSQSLRAPKLGGFGTLAASYVSHSSGTVLPGHSASGIAHGSLHQPAGPALDHLGCTVKAGCRVIPGVA
jgi:hypothetical protein